MIEITIIQFYFIFLNHYFFQPCHEIYLYHIETRNSAIADKPRDAFGGQSRSPNMVPFDALGIISN